MMGRSKDHRSAGLWWSLLLSDGSLGGHDRLLESFQSLIITFIPTGAAVDYSVTKSTVTSGQRKWPACLSSFLISVGTDLGGHGRLLKSFQSLIITFVLTGAAVNYSVMKFTVTSGQRKWPACLSSFLISIGTDLGGHGRSLGLFGHCLIFSVICCSWRRCRSSYDWVRCGSLGNSPWTTGRCGGPASFIFSGFWLVLP